MNKHTLAAELADRNNISQRDAAALIDSLIDIMVENLQGENDELTLRGFGKFTVEMAGARTGRNIRTNEPLKIEPRLRLKFKPYLELAK